MRQEPQQISLFDIGRECLADPEDTSGFPSVRSLAGDRVAGPRERPSLRVLVLGSGSRGNSVVVESDCGRLLVDAGFSCRELEKRLQRSGVAPDSLAALLLTHEHGDHCRGAVRFAKRHRVPVYGTRGTLSSRPLRRLEGGVAIASGVALEVSGFRIEPFALPHDAREPVGFAIEDPGGYRVGLLSDLGSRSHLAWARLRDADLLILESNYDLDMLRRGPYPWALKHRVASNHGHLSNDEAARGLDGLVGDRLRWVVLYHLSETNNLPALAYATVAEALDRLRCSARIAMTSQLEPTAWLAP